jgi:hypothetical protein
MPKLFFEVALLGLLVIGTSLIVTTAVAVSRYWLSSIDYTIVRSGLECEHPYNNRCVMALTVRLNDGSTEKLHPTQFPKEQLQSGFALKKDRFAFSYLLNDRVMQWEYGSNYLIRVIVGTLCLILWFPNRRKTLGARYAE